MAHIYSTLTAGQTYCTYKKINIPGEQRPRSGIIEKRINIKGGHKIHARHDGKDTQAYTPQGVVTEVTEEELEILRTIPQFVEHEKNGFIIAIAGNKVKDKEKIAADMKSSDGSSPKTPKDYSDPSNKDNASKPTVHSVGKIPV
jgi:IS5 family transposase